jgi:hypothetical protein
MFNVQIRVGDGDQGTLENIPRIKIDLLSMIPGASDVLK